MKTIQSVAFFVNSTGENNNLQHFIKNLPTCPFKKITLLALDETLPSYTQFPDKNRKERLQEIIKNSNTKELELVAESLQKQNWPACEIVRLEGRFPGAITDWTAQNDIDLLIKQSLPCDGDFGNASKGDIKLSRQIESSILLLHSEITSGSPVLAAVPPVFKDRSGLKMATRVLQTAAPWAKTLQAPLTILRAWELFGEQVLANRIPAAELQDALKEEEQRVREDLAVVLDNVEIPKPFETSMHKGDPTRVIHTSVDSVKPGLVIMGSASNDGIQGLFLGNTAESLVRKKETSVLIVK